MFLSCLTIFPYQLLPLSSWVLPTTSVKSILQMILFSHRDRNEGAIFSPDQVRRESEAHERRLASKQAREKEKEGGRETGIKSFFFVCVAAVGGSELRQGAEAAAGKRRRDKRSGWKRDPQQHQAAGETPLRWDTTHTADLNSNQNDDYIILHALYLLYGSSFIFRIDYVYFNLWFMWIKARNFLNLFETDRCQL